MESLSKYIFSAPSWPTSLTIIVVLGFLIDGASFRFGQNARFFGTLEFTIPALTGLLLTGPLVSLMGRRLTWNRSALLALSCTVLGIIITLTGMVISVALLPLSFAIATGFVFGTRLVTLAAIVDYRISRIIVPAFIQSGTGVLIGMVFFDPPFFVLALLLHLVFGTGFILLIWAIDRPLYRAFHIHILSFLNTFIAHLTDGSKTMEDFFREIGEEVYVPEVSLFFNRENGRGVIFTVPNVHPGPMGEIGGGNLPTYLQNAFYELVMVSHGTATHDFNLVAEEECEKIVAAIRAGKDRATYLPEASRAYRCQHGDVTLLYQVFGRTLLMVSSRSPRKTEDIDIGIGMTIMAEGHRSFPHVAFVDAHNCFTGDIANVSLGSLASLEYLQAASHAIDAGPELEQYPLEVGVSQVVLPFTRVQGFGDQGIETLAIRAGGQTTAYVLIDGNNVLAGVREILRDHTLTLVDEAEIMTTDSHVVNMVSGKNPIGYTVPPEQIIPYLEQSVRNALDDLSPASAGGDTALCERVVVFGSQRIAQLASTVNAMVLFIPPLSIGMLLLAFLLSVVIYLIIA
jgi:putative membrane protein